jgi:serine/threonine-protein kinase
VIGREIGNYRITQRLGQGGVGEVFAGVDQMLNRPVAIKALRAEFGRDPGVLARFRSEAESLARLNHPNITMLYSLQREGEELFMIMELVRGRTLEALLASCRRLSEQQALAITAQALDGLGYAHGAGVIHRDIKTGNLMVGASGLLKIMDFGIARMRGSGRLTRQGHIVGTLAYMSPEQIRGEEGDERSDLYSLAIVLYELLSGDPPFVSDSEYELIRAQVEAVPPRLIGRVSGVRPEIEKALMRALAKRPADRFATAAELGRALGVSDLGGKAVDVVRQALGSAVSGATRMGVSAPAEPLRGPGDVSGGPAAPATRLARPGEGGSLGTTIAKSRASGPRLPSRLPVAALAIAGVMVAGVVVYAVVDLVGERSTLTQTEPAEPPRPSSDGKEPQAEARAVTGPSIPGGTAPPGQPPTTSRMPTDQERRGPSESAARTPAEEPVPVPPEGSAPTAPPQLTDLPPVGAYPAQETVKPPLADDEPPRSQSKRKPRRSAKSPAPEQQPEPPSGWQYIR